MQPGPATKPEKESGHQLNVVLVSLEDVCWMVQERMNSRIVMCDGLGRFMIANILCIR